MYTTSIKIPATRPYGSNGIWEPKRPLDRQLWGIDAIALRSFAIQYVNSFIL